MYCDQTTYGGSWALLTQITQPAGFSSSMLDDCVFSRLVQGELWIEGLPGTIPTNPTPSYSDTIVISSHDWKKYLKADSLNQIRYQVHKGEGEMVLDAMYTFYFAGSLRPSFTQSSISLVHLDVLRDDAGIMTVAESDVGSWQEMILPYAGSDGITPSDFACINAMFGSMPCGMSPANSSGVIAIRSSAGNDIWAPFFTQDDDADIVYVPSAPSVYGKSKDAMTLNYWVRPVKTLVINTERIGHSFSLGSSGSQSTVFDYIADGSTLRGGNRFPSVVYTGHSPLEIRVRAHMSICE